MGLGGERRLIFATCRVVYDLFFFFFLLSTKKIVCLSVCLSVCLFVCMSVITNEHIEKIKDFSN